MRSNQREDKFLRTSNVKHYGSECKAAKPAAKVKKGFKAFSITSAIALTAAILIIPTTTLAPDVDAYEDSRAASLAVGGIDEFSAVITNNCVEVTLPPATEPQTTEEAKKATQKVEESSKEDSKENEKSKTKETEAETEPAEEESSSKSEESSEQSSEESEASESESSGYVAGGISLSSYDRAKLERLVMGEAGSTGYYGCALVAQCIRDAMVRSDTSSIDKIISDYGYYGSTATEPNSDVKNAVSFIFDQNSSAVDHRILVFYVGNSSWHETQNFVTEYCGMRFFDLNE